jgi:hypothetical protein
VGRQFQRRTNGWRLGGVGDLNGDGKADMVFRRTDGTFSAYLMNGFQVISAAVVANVSPEYDSCYGDPRGALAQVSQQQ